MKIVRTRWLPPRGYSGINLLGVLFVHPNQYVSPTMLNHERIHTAQMLELAIIPFYILYLIEWLIRLPMRGRAYRNISFEREAYRHEHDFDYLNNRRHYAWLKFLKNKHNGHRTRHSHR